MCAVLTLRDFQVEALLNWEVEVEAGHKGAVGGREVGIRGFVSKRESLGFILSVKGNLQRMQNASLYQL